MGHISVIEQAPYQNKLKWVTPLPRSTCRSPAPAQARSCVTASALGADLLSNGMVLTPPALRSRVASSGCFGRTSRAPDQRGTPGVSLGSPRRSSRLMGVGQNGEGEQTKGEGDGSRMGMSEEAVELPLFPLPMVLFPGGILPLQIFEYRYRIMMQTMLQTDMRFGVVFTGGQQGVGPLGGAGGGVASASAVGCVGQIVRHERLPDDRFFLICKGEERFRVVDIVRTRPYLVGQVEWLEDRPSSARSSAGGSDVSSEVISDPAKGIQPPASLDSLADEVASLMSDVIRLTRKLKGSSAVVGAEGSLSGSGSGGGGGSSTEAHPMDVRKASFPTPFSFWVASTFEGAPAEQQALLELVDTAERLQREKETLRSTLNYLSAAAAVRDAFPSSGSP